MVVEKTFAGFGPSLRDDGIMAVDGELYEVGKDLFDGEEVIDKIYRSYIALLCKGWKSKIETTLTPGNMVPVIGESYIKGFYLPCAKRMALLGQVDLYNDDLPNYAGIVVPNDYFLAISVIKGIPPRGVMRYPRGEHYRTTIFFESKGKALIDQSLELRTFHVAVKENGVVVPCIPFCSDKNGDMAVRCALSCQASALALNLHTDSRFLWTIETSENLVSNIKTPLRLGVNKDHVKSLFYARNLPVTDSGRKRPILHWVRAHQRRISNGTDIDVDKHLRGITEFTMDGLNFRITRPIKSNSAT